MMIMLVEQMFVQVHCKATKTLSVSSCSSKDRCLYLHYLSASSIIIGTEKNDSWLEYKLVANMLMWQK